MYRTIYTVALLLLLVACASPKVDRQLTAIEQIMNEHPDSALAQLEEMDADHITNHRQRACYALLYSQALDKNYIDLANDSIINIAVEYYDDSNDLYRKMLAYYYLGRVKYNAQEYSQAIFSLLTAEKIALETEDFFYQGLIYRNMSYIYHLIYHGKAEIECSQKSYDAFKRTQHEQYTNYALLNLGNAYYNNNDYGISEDIIQQTIHISTTANDTLLHWSAKQLLGNIYFSQKKFAQALQIFEELKSWDETALQYDDYINLSLCHLYTGNTETARKYAQKVYQMDSLQTWCLYKVEKNRKNYKEALQYLENEINLQNNILRDITKQDVLQSVSLFQKKEEQENLLREKNRRNMWIASISAIVIALTILSLYLINKKNQKLQQNINKVIYLQEILQNKDDEYNKDIQQKFREIFSARFHIIDDLCQGMFEKQTLKSTHKKISEEVENLIYDLSYDSDKMRKIEEFINQNYDNVITSLKADLPNLKEADYLIFVYSILKFSIPTMSYLLQEEKVDAIYNRKARLKNKIKQLQSDKKEQYLQYL